jgi:hypothetical protein
MTLNLGRGDRLADTPRIAAERIPVSIGIAANDSVLSAMASTDPKLSPSANAWNSWKAPCRRPTVTACLRQPHGAVQVGRERLSALRQREAAQPRAAAAGPVVPQGAGRTRQGRGTVQKRWWGQDSNLCSPFGRRFYRPLPLTARPPHPGARQLANFTSLLLTAARPAPIHPLNSRAAPT